MDSKRLDERVDDNMSTTWKSVAHVAHSSRSTEGGGSSACRGPSASLLLVRVEALC